jgi:heme/copper-type cytochrome/quinol oxidase subunit 3
MSAPELSAPRHSGELPAPASHAPLAAAPPAPPARPRVVVVGTALAAAGVLVFFAGALAVYAQLRSRTLATEGSWLPEDSVFPLQQPNVMLLALLMGSITIQWAVDAIKRDDRPQAYLALGLTEVFGFAVLNMAAYLYSIMTLDAASGVMAVMTYTITGAHLAVLVVAMVFVALMAFRALGGQYTSRQHDGMSAAALFWHAQVVVFAFIWFAIYITK